MHTFICITVIVDTRTVQGGEKTETREHDTDNIKCQRPTKPILKLKAVLESAQNDYGVRISIQEVLRDGLDSILNDMDVETYLKNKGLI